MRFFLLFVICIIIGAGGSLTYLSWQAQQKTKATENARVLQAQWPKFKVEKAPSDSLRGTMVSHSGGVKWESRVATESSLLTKAINVQQGEKISTQENGNTVITFPSNVTINIHESSELSFIQTLPQSIVLEQDTGLIDYESGNTTISIRSLHLLTRLSKAKATVHIDEENSSVTIAIKKGEAQLGFNDSDSITQQVNLKEGDTYMFDDLTRVGSLE